MLRGKVLKKIAGLTAVGLAVISIQEPVRAAMLRDGSFVISEISGEALPADDPVSLKDIPEDAIKALNDILGRKEVMALVYLTDECRVYARSDEASDIIATLIQGHTVYIKGAAFSGNNADGASRKVSSGLMYKVSFYNGGLEYEGYVRAEDIVFSDEDLISWEKEYLYDNDLFPGRTADKSDDSAGTGQDGLYEDVSKFPESYHKKLNELKDKHPNWIFVPLNTGLDFNSAVDNEMGDKSWIYINDSNKEKGWVGNATGQGKWAYATKAGVSYHMDTRNSLTEAYIFQFEQLTFNKSYHTMEAVQTFLNGTFMKGNLPDGSMSFAEAFYKIGFDNGVSPIHLASRVYQEQGKGTSPLISGTYSGYEGYYNYFNVGATGSSDSEVIKNGLKYAKEHGWDTPYKSLEGGAATIGNNYIKKGQDTGYLQKFNVDPGASHALYTHQYMQNIQAPRSEASSTKTMYAGAGCLDSPFVFKIPVFKNMNEQSAGSSAVSIKKAVVSGIEAKTYTGNEDDVKCIPELTLKDGTVLNGILKDGYDKLDQAEALKYDYIYSYKNTHKAGKASVIIKGVNAYKGKVTKTYKINKASFADMYEEYRGNEVSGNEINGFGIKYYSATDALLKGLKVYKNGVGLAEDVVKEAGVSVNSIKNLEEITDIHLRGGSRPQIIIYFGGVQLDKKSYSVTYTRCSAVTAPDMEESKQPMITITGKGNFKGKIKAVYTITDGCLADEAKVTLTASDKKYSKKKNAWKASVKLKDIDGKKLRAGKDYEKIVEYTYAEDNPSVLDKSGEVLKRRAGEGVSANDIPQEGTLIRATVTGKGAYAGTSGTVLRSVTYRIIAPK